MPNLRLKNHDERKHHIRKKMAHQPVQRNQLANASQIKCRHYRRQPGEHRRGTRPANHRQQLIDNQRHQQNVEYRKRYSQPWRRHLHLHLSPAEKLPVTEPYILNGVNASLASLRSLAFASEEESRVPRHLIYLVFSLPFVVSALFTVARISPRASRAEISSPNLSCAASFISCPALSKTSAYPRSRIASGDNVSKARPMRSSRSFLSSN